MSAPTRSNVFYALAVVLVGGSAVFIHSAQSSGKMRLIKAPLPLRKDLDRFDRRKLAPEEVVSVQKLPPETVEELGTENYFTWVLRMPEIRGKNRTVTLSVTYYTGVVDQVPHVPEECFVQGAFTMAENGDEELDLDLENFGRKIPVRRLTFYAPRDTQLRTIVYYTICVNGDFYAQRNRVRLRMADWNDTHLYYAKIEVSFKSKSNTDYERLDRRARDVFDRTIAELVSEHFPPGGWERGGPPAASANGGGESAKVGSAL
jgi:hypothetical protein